MIKNFRCGETQKIWEGFSSRRLPYSIQQTARRKLRMLHRAEIVDDLRVPPANRLELLKGNRQGQYSIRINDQWRVCFRFSDAEAYDVEIIDYH